MSKAFSVCRLWSVIILFSVLLIGCQYSLADKIATPGATDFSSGNGVVRVAVPSVSGYERTFMPQSFPSITRYNVYLQPVGAGVSRESLGISSPDLAVFEGVTAGDWKIVIEGFDGLNGFIAAGETQFVLASGESTTVNVVLAPPASGSGSFAASFLFPDEGSNVEGVSFILKEWPSGTEVPNVNYTVSRDSGAKTVSISSAPLACGQYLLEVNYSLATVNGPVFYALPPHVIHIYNTLSSVPKDGQPIVCDTIWLTKTHATYFVGGDGTGSGKNPSNPCTFEYALLQLIDKANFLTLDRPGVIMLVDSQASWAPAGSTQIDIPVRVTSLNQMSPNVLKIEPAGTDMSAFRIGNASTLVAGSKAKMMFDHVTVRPLSPAELPAGSGTLCTLTNGVLELGEGAVFDGYFGVSSSGSIVHVSGGGLFRMLMGSTISGSSSISGGGAVYLDGTPSNDSIFARAEIAGTITGCRSDGNGGAVLAEGGVVEMQPGALISMNEAYSGAGLYIAAQARLVVTGGETVGNTISSGSSGKGGGIYAASWIECNGSSVSLPFIKQNSSGSSGQGGGLWTDYTGGKPIRRDGAEPDYATFLSFFGTDADVNFGESFATSNMCSITFDMQGGFPELPTEYVRAGTILTEPDVPYKGGADFSGWYQDVAYTMPWYFSDPVNYNLQLHAMWVSNDSEPPTLTINGGGLVYTNQNSVTLSGTAFDTGGSGVNRVEYSTNMGSSWFTAMGTDTWSFTMSGLSQSTYNWMVRAIDNAGNESTFQNPSITVDWTTPSVSIVSPTNNSYVYGQVNLTGNASDAIGITVVEFSVDGGVWTPATGTSSWNALINTDILAEGIHTISVRGIDFAGNITTLPWSVTVDRTNPLLSGQFPSAGIWVTNPSVTMQATAQDSAGPVVSVTFILDSVSYPVSNSMNYSPFNATMASPVLSEGVHTLRIETVDRAGRVTAIPEYTFTVDTIAPVVTVTQPVNNQNIIATSNFALEATVVDAFGITSVQYTIDGGVNGSGTLTFVSGNTWSAMPQAPSDTTTHSVGVFAVDSAGNISPQVTVSINVVPE